MYVQKSLSIQILEKFFNNHGSQWNQVRVINRGSWSNFEADIMWDNPFHMPVTFLVSYFYIILPFSA